ncbi:hypothetical protein GDO86_012419, partial [Hymenochirus boettgeri]
QVAEGERRPVELAVRALYLARFLKVHCNMLSFILVSCCCQDENNTFYSGSDLFSLRLLAAFFSVFLGLGNSISVQRKKT